MAEQIVVLGSGIIGLCSAYYLLTSPDLPEGSTVTLIENSKRGGIAPGASSFAGGFLAGGTGNSWQAAASRPLARLSWKEHVALAKKLDGLASYGFRDSIAVGLRVGDGEEERSAYRQLPTTGKAQTVEKDWLRGVREDLTGDGGVGQIDPAQFCQVLHAHCTSLGLLTYFAEPLSLSPLTPSSSSRQLAFRLHSSLRVERHSFTKFVVAAGPWSAALADRLELPSFPLTNLPGHSLLIRPSPNVELPDLPAEAVFAGISGGEFGVEASTSGAARHLNEEELAIGFTRSPELFPRTNGLVYVAGENTIPNKLVTGGSLPNKLPDSVDGVGELLDDKLVTRLLIAAGTVSPRCEVAMGAVLEKAQFCYRPIFRDGEPVIDELESGVYLATGHGPWGITLAPGTGRVVSEMVLGGNKPLSADISGLRLNRFR